MNSTVLLIGGVALFAAGLLVGYLMARRPDQEKAAEELEVVKADFESYQQGVTQHFRETAGHFQDLGERYRALYAHMADGAKTLCPTATGQESIEFAPQPELLQPEAAPDAEPRAVLRAAAAGAAEAEAAAAGDETASDSRDAEVAEAGREAVAGERAEEEPRGKADEGPEADRSAAADPVGERIPDDAGTAEGAPEKSLEERLREAAAAGESSTEPPEDPVQSAAGADDRSASEASDDEKRPEGNGPERDQDTTRRMARAESPESRQPGSDLLH